MFPIPWELCERMVQQAKLLPRPKAVPSAAPVSPVIPADTAVGVKREAPEAPKAEELPAGDANVEKFLCLEQTGLNGVEDWHNLVLKVYLFILILFKEVFS